MSEEPQEISQVTYEQLAGIEDEFEDIDAQISTFPLTLLQEKKRNPLSY